MVHVTGYAALLSHIGVLISSTDQIHYTAYPEVCRLAIELPSVFSEDHVFTVYDGQDDDPWEDPEINRMQSLPIRLFEWVGSVFNLGYGDLTVYGNEMIVLSIGGNSGSGAASIFIY